MESLRLTSNFLVPPTTLSTGLCGIQASRNLKKFGAVHQLNSAQQRSIFHQTHDRKWCLNAAFEYPLESDSGANNLNDIWNSVKTAADAFHRFSRPHTVKGTTISVISVSLLAIRKFSDFTPLFFVGMLQVVVAANLMNIYIVGLNQLFDIDIDKVNKPYLPLASGEYSVGTGILIVSFFSIMGFLVGLFSQSWPLCWGLFSSFVLGTAYSLNVPFLRWKRSVILSAMCILGVRAMIIPTAYFLHIQSHVFSRPAALPRPVIFTCTFMLFFSIVITLFKDIPDIDGDKIHGIRTLTVRLGQKKVFWICMSLLQMAYTVAILVGLTSTSVWSKALTVSGHALLALILWIRATSLDLKSNASITSFYMFIWKLFYAEYFLIPFVR